MAISSRVLSRWHAIVLACLCVCVVHPVRVFAQWQPISPEDLKLTSAQAGNAEAIILYHEETSSDIKKSRSIYMRIKILTEKGKRYADVEIPYRKEGDFSTQIIDVKARTISPDGKITPFSGETFDKTIVKTHGLKYKAKTFTMPDVQVGSIIEWRYSLIWSDTYVLPARWILQEDLAQKKVKFLYTPLNLGNYDVSAGHGDYADNVYRLPIGLPKGVEVKFTPRNDAILEMNDVPAYEEEDFSPPAAMMKMRVYFYYGTSKMLKPDEFWREEGKYWDKEVDKFMGHSDAVTKAAEGAVSPNDTPEQKARKLYAFVQKLRNFTYQGETQDAKVNLSAEQVLHQQGGTHDDLTRLYVAMVRSLRIPAYLMRVGTREEIFFQANIPDSRQLNSEVAIVSVAEGKETFLDPGTQLCPFGLLAWNRTTVQGLRQKPGGGTELSQTPQPDYSQAITQRVADLKLDKDGNLKGQIVLLWTGQRALDRRIEGAQTDEAGRKKLAEDELKTLLPDSSVVKLNSTSGWDDPIQPLQARFDVELPGAASSTGKRLILPSGLFQVKSRQRFVSAERKTPVYFDYPYRVVDKVTIAVPPDLQLENLPQGQKANSEFAICYIERSFKNNVLELRRDFVIAGISFPLAIYPKLKSFFETVHANDDDQITLRVGAVAATNSN